MKQFLRLDFNPKLKKKKFTWENNSQLNEIDCFSEKIPHKKMQKMAAFQSV